MIYEVELGEKIITLEHDNFDDIINVDSLTKIDPSNIFGEAVTISAAVNRIGLMKAEVEGRMAEAKLDCKIYEGNFVAGKRKEAANNGGFYFIRVETEDVKVKATQGALDTCFENDKGWIEKKKLFIKAEKNFNALSSLYWACQDKARKLNGLTSGTTPQEFVAGLIQGKVNGLLVNVDGNAGSIG